MNAGRFEDIAAKVRTADAIPAALADLPPLRDKLMATLAKAGIGLADLKMAGGWSESQDDSVRRTWPLTSVPTKAGGADAALVLTDLKGRGHSLLLSLPGLSLDPGAVGRLMTLACGGDGGLECVAAALGDARITCDIQCLVSSTPEPAGEDWIRLKAVTDEKGGIVRFGPDAKGASARLRTVEIFKISGPGKGQISLGISTLGPHQLHFNVDISTGGKSPLITFDLTAGVALGSGLQGVIDIVGGLTGLSAPGQDSFKVTGLAPLNGVRLTKMRILFDGWKVPDYVSFELATANSIKVFDGLVIEDLGFRVFMEAGNAFITPFGSARLAGKGVSVYLDASIQIPLAGGAPYVFELSGQLEADEGLDALMCGDMAKSLGNVGTALGPNARDGVAFRGFSVNSLAVAYGGAAGGLNSLAFDFTVAADISFRGITLRNPQFELNCGRGGTVEDARLEGELVLGKAGKLVLGVSAAYLSGVWRFEARYLGEPQSLGTIWAGLGGRADQLGFLKDVSLNTLMLSYGSGADWSWGGDLRISTPALRCALELSHGATKSSLKGELKFGADGGKGKTLAQLTGAKDLPKAVGALCPKALTIAYQRDQAETATTWSLKFKSDVELGGMALGLDCEVGTAQTVIGATVTARDVRLGTFLQALGLQDQAGGQEDAVLSGGAGFRYCATAAGPGRLDVFAAWKDNGLFLLSLHKKTAEEGFSPALGLWPGDTPWMRGVALRWAARQDTARIELGGTAKSVEFMAGFGGGGTFDLKNTRLRLPNPIQVVLDQDGLKISADGKTPTTALSPISAPPPAAPAPDGTKAKAKDADEGKTLTLDKSLSLKTILDLVSRQAESEQPAWRRTLGNALVLDKAGIAFTAKPPALTVFGDVTVNVGSWLSVSAKRAAVKIIPTSLSAEGLRRARLEPDLNGGALSIDVPPWIKAGAAIVRHREAGQKPGDLALMGLGRLTLLDKVGISALAYVAWRNSAVDEAFGFVCATGLTVGTPAFTLTGIAGGLGYNCVLELPDRPEDVAGFPAVALLRGETSAAGAEGLMKDLAAFKTSLKSRPGAWCIAFGLTFRVAQLVECLALAVVELRNPQVEVAMVGLADLPIRAGGKAKSGAAGPARSLGHIQLAIAARVSSATGIVRILGGLTDKSWIFDPKCRLQGEFAVCLWLDGPNKGDFLVSMGGYSPLVPKKPHYPALKRVGFSWAPADGLLIMGGAYLTIDRFGLQFGCAARLRFENAALTVDAMYSLDAVMFWAPAYFKAGIRVSCHVELRKYVTLRLGLDVEMQAWGPPFGATMAITVSMLCLSYSHTVKIGLPEREPLATMDDVLALAARGNGDLLHIACPGTPAGKAGREPCLRSDDVAFTLSLAVPATKIQGGRQEWNAEAQALDIRPMRRKNVTSTMTFSVRPLSATGESGSWEQTPQTATPVEALWYYPGPSDAELLAPSRRKAATAVVVRPGQGRSGPRRTISLAPDTLARATAKPGPAARRQGAPSRPALTKAGFPLEGCR